MNLKHAEISNLEQKTKKLLANDLETFIKPGKWQTLVTVENIIINIIILNNIQINFQ